MKRGSVRGAGDSGGTGRPGRPGPGVDGRAGEVPPHCAGDVRGAPACIPAGCRANLLFTPSITDRLTEGLARDLTEELTGNRAGFLDREPELPLEPVSVPGTDGFWWAEENRTMAHDQFAVLRQGKQVLAIWYTGPTDLRTETAYLASLLPD